MTKSDAERIAVVETRMDVVEGKVDTMAKQVADIHTRVTLSRGAVIGAWAVLGTVVGVIAFFVNNFLGLLVNHNPPPQ